MQWLYRKLALGLLITGASLILIEQLYVLAGIGQLLAFAGTMLYHYERGKNKPGGMTR